MENVDRPVVFDHQAIGRPASAWAARRAALPSGPILVATDHLLVVAAHPDDETLGAGGLIACAAALGATVTVIVATNGEASHPHSPTHAPQQLACIRRSEARMAVASLSQSADLDFLHFPDGGLRHDARALLGVLRRASYVPSLVAAPWRGDGHPDHRASGEAAATYAAEQGVPLLEFPIWGWHWGQPGHTGPLADTGFPGARWIRAPLSTRTHAAKTTALSKHRSQHQRLSTQAGDEAVLSPRFLQHFTGPDEVFLESSVPITAAAPAERNQLGK